MYGYLEVCEGTYVILDPLYKFVTEIWIKLGVNFCACE